MEGVHHPSWIFATLEDHYFAILGTIEPKSWILKPDILFYSSIKQLKANPLPNGPSIGFAIEILKKSNIKRYCFRVVGVFIKTLHPLNIMLFYIEGFVVKHISALFYSSLSIVKTMYSFLFITAKSFLVLDFLFLQTSEVVSTLFEILTT